MENFHDINTIVFLIVMSFMAFGGPIAIIFLARAFMKEEREQVRKEQEWARAVSLLANVSFGPVLLASIEEGTRGNTAKISWFDKGRESIELPKRLFHFEDGGDYQAPTVEFVLDGAHLLRSGLVPVTIDEESVKKLSITKEFVLPKSVVKVVVRTSKIYEPFSLKKICSAFFESEHQEMPKTKEGGHGET